SHRPREARLTARQGEATIFQKYYLCQELRMVPGAASWEETVPKAKKLSNPDQGRRNLLKGAAFAGAAVLASPATAKAPSSGTTANRIKASPPGVKLAAAETMPPQDDPVTQTSGGGDFMVDVFKTLGIEYLAMNCASSFRGLHEAVIN